MISYDKKCAIIIKDRQHGFNSDLRDFKLMMTDMSQYLGNSKNFYVSWNTLPHPSATQEFWR